MKRSNILYGTLFGMFVILLIAGFTVPQDVLDYYEIYFMLIYMPILGTLWFWAYLDGLELHLR